MYHLKHSDPTDTNSCLHELYTVFTLIGQDSIKLLQLRYRLKMPRPNRVFQ